MIIQNQTAQILPFLAPCEWLCIDIETGDAPDDFIQAAMADWQPPSNIKDPEKIEARRQEAMEKIAERGALLDASPILCVVAKSNDSRVVFQWIAESSEIGGYQVLADADEKAMLQTFRTWLNARTNQQTEIVGHNVKGFDLPKLRNAYIRHRLKLPDILAIHANPEDAAKVTDTAMLFKAFSMQHRNDFCPSIGDMAQSLGLERPKAVISGADVPRLHKEGRNIEILTYCAGDVETTANAYLLMTGQHTALS